jgi:AAA15 family ATPase/GTPase
MLVEFKIRNYRSFKDETSLLMTSVKSFKEHANKNVVTTDFGLNLLKSAVVYGANGAGKTNLILAFSAMSKIIRSSYKNTLNKSAEEKNYHFQFLLNTSTAVSPTMFEASFIKDNILYRYGFEIFGSGIIRKEWLFKKSSNRETLYFQRTGLEFEINKRAFVGADKFKNQVNENVLFLSLLLHNNHELSKPVLNWFRYVNSISGLKDETHQAYTAEILKTDKRFKKWAEAAVKYLEISSIEYDEESAKIVAYHNLYDSNDILVGTVPFPVLQYESEGTKKLVHILGPLYDTLRNGKVLFWDEFDAKLHPILSQKFIQLFHHFNKKGAQFIFSAQDPSLMIKENFRRDQIWLVEKNQFGASKLYPLSDFSGDFIRNTSAFDRKYLSGELGAADTLEITDNLINLLYGEED